MKFSSQSQSLIESIIRKAMDKFANNGQTVITDIHLQPLNASGELLVFDDNDEELACTVIEEWLNYNGQDFYKDVERLLHVLLDRMKSRGDFEKLPIVTPYSFVLVDEDKETITDLLLVGDDTLLINDTLLKGLDEELNEFLKDLLEK